MAADLEQIAMDAAYQADRMDVYEQLSETRRRRLEATTSAIAAMKNELKDYADAKEVAQEAKLAAHEARLQDSERKHEDAQFQIESRYLEIEELQENLRKLEIEKLQENLRKLRKDQKKLAETVAAIEALKQSDDQKKRDIAELSAKYDLYEEDKRARFEILNGKFDEAIMRLESQIRALSALTMNRDPQKTAMLQATLDAILGKNDLPDSAAPSSPPTKSAPAPSTPT